MALTRLSVLAYPESRVWNTARCLEHDILVSGRSADLAVDSLLKMIRAHINYDIRHHRAPLSGFGPAPKRYREAFLNASRHWVFDDVPWTVSGITTAIEVAVVSEHPAIRTFAAAARTA